MDIIKLHNSRHLRTRHCTKEGGSYVCRYGFNGVCASLPLDGVNDRDYDNHVNKYHVNQVRELLNNSSVVRVKERASPQVMKETEQWSVYLAAQNLPAVLNDPSRAKQTSFFTKKWGDSFVEKVPIGTSPHLPAVTWPDFEFYSNRIGKRFHRHNRMKAAFLERQQSSSSPGGGLNNQTASNSNRQQLGNYNNSEGSLRDIPQIFMKHDLVLSDPQTFTLVFPGYCDTLPGAQNSAPNDTKPQHQQSGRLLQEKLSHYLDIVEVQIAHQVSQKSSAFFHAMTSQDTIMEQMNEAAGNVKRLRKQIKLLDDTVVKDALKVIQLERSRANQQQVLEKLKLMATVHQTQPMIQLLLGEKSFMCVLINRC